MAVKPDAKAWTILEQIIEDRASGLTLQFEVVDDGTCRLRVFGKYLPFGNREVVFDREGIDAGGGTCLVARRPTWLSEVD